MIETAVYGKITVIKPRKFHCIKILLKMIFGKINLNLRDLSTTVDDESEPEKIKKTDRREKENITANKTIETSIDKHV